MVNILLPSPYMAARGSSKADEQHYGHHEHALYHPSFVCLYRGQRLPWQHIALCVGASKYGKPSHLTFVSYSSRAVEKSPEIVLICSSSTMNFGSLNFDWLPCYGVFVQPIGLFIHTFHSDAHPVLVNKELCCE